MASLVVASGYRCTPEKLSFTFGNEVGACGETNLPFGFPLSTEVSPAPNRIVRSHEALPTRGYWFATPPPFSRHLHHCYMFSFC